MSVIAHEATIEGHFDVIIKVHDIYLLQVSMFQPRFKWDAFNHRYEKKGWIGNSIYILSSVEHTGSKHCPTCMVIMLMNSILFMRIITIASCAMFVSGLFKITEPKIAYSIE